MFYLALLAAAAAAIAQPSLSRPPTTAPLTAAGTEQFERERENFERSLRETCLSERGIALVIEDWARNRAAAHARMPSILSREEEVARAIHRDPVDMATLERGLLEDARMQSQFAAERAERAISVLRRLSPEDRAIYARSFTNLQPTEGVRRCNGSK